MKPPLVVALGVVIIQVPTRVLSAFEREPNGEGVKAALKPLARGVVGAAIATVDVNGFPKVLQGAGEGICRSRVDWKWCALLSVALVCRSSVVALYVWGG